jgi:hypothetical protein
MELEAARKAAVKRVAEEIMDLGYTERGAALELMTKAPTYPHRIAPFDALVHELDGLDLQAASYHGFRADVLSELFPGDVIKIVGDVVLIEGGELYSIMTGHRATLTQKPARRLREIATKRAVEDYALAGEEKAAEIAAIDAYIAVCTAGGIPKGQPPLQALTGFVVDHVVDYLRTHRHARTPEAIREELGDQWLAEEVAGTIPDDSDRKSFLEEAAHTLRHPAFAPSVYASILGGEIIAGSIIAITDAHGCHHGYDTATGEMTKCQTSTRRRSVHRAAVERAREDYALALAAHRDAAADRAAFHTYQNICGMGIVP